MWAHSLQPSPPWKGGTVITLHEKLVGYVQDAHAMEENSLTLLDSMIATTTDPDTLERLREHRHDTERHAHLLKHRLAELGEARSITADVAAMTGAVLKGVADLMRTDKPGKNARDAFITEQAEVAAYELLERL